MNIDFQEVIWEGRTGLFWLRIETAGSLREHGNGLPVFIKYGEFPDKLRADWLLKKYSAPWT
jgi:hypothetical protein